MSNDSSAALLVEQMSRIENRRRLNNMRIRELEEKIAFEVNKESQLKLKSDAIAQHEDSLREDLNRLNNLHRSILMQSLAAAERAKLAEKEEPLLLANVQQSLNTADSLISSFENSLMKAAKSKEIWERDCAIVNSKAEISRMMSELSKLEEYHQNLQKKITSLHNCWSSLQLSLHTTNQNHGGSNFSPQTEGANNTLNMPLEADTDSQNSLGDAISTAEMNLKSMEVRFSRIKSVLEREIDQLATKEAELSNIVVAADQQTRKIRFASSLVQHQIASSTCYRCLGSILPDSQPHRQN